jgi:protein-disulfide isomerase
MTKYYLLAIPIVIGIITGMFLAFNPESKSESSLLTTIKLIENGSPIIGDPDAPITILEWGDYQCTYCYKFHQSTLNTINENFIKTGKVKLVFKDYPLNGPDSVLAAEASHCAQDQEKYWQYHDELYKNWGGERTGWITRESLNQFGNTVNLNMDYFNTCLNEHKYKDKVISMYEFGKEVGIDATPSFLVFNDQKIVKIRGNQRLRCVLRGLL